MLALCALLSLLALASASPVQKRYTSAKIQSYRDGQCLGLASSNYANGVQVVKVDCANAPGWDINPGSGSIVLSGTNFALDAGTGADNNEIVKIWQSYPTLFQQTWYLTGDQRIAITGGNQCLDEGDNGPQTYQCTTGNTNQVWSVLTGGTPVSSSASHSASATSSSTSSASTGIPTGTVVQDPANGGHRIHPYGRDDLCVTVGNGYAAQGTVVNIAYCFANSDTYAGLQLWNATSTSNGAISLVQHPEYCLDGGSNPSDGSPITINTCGNGDKQDWNFGNGKLQLGDTQYCLDLQLGSGVTNENPYSIEENLQIWTCYDGNTQQQFHEL